MEENNNNNNNQTVTPVTSVPETTVSPVDPVADQKEGHPVPSLVIEDNAKVETPVTSVPETPVIPVAPAEPKETPAADVPANEKTKPAKKNNNIIAIVIIVVCLVIAAVYFLTKKDNTPTPTPEPAPSGPVTPATGENDLNSLSLNQASLNGVTFTFPETKASFNNVGWTWEASYAQNNIEPGIGTNGGRIGTAPGGASVLVINKGTQATHIEDCTIYSATFYNPKDGSENVTFVGGLVYTSTSDVVKSRMKELGYNKVSESVIENTLSLKYFLNDDTSNTSDYIEFYFVDNIIETVTISTAV